MDFDSNDPFSVHKGHLVINKHSAPFLLSLLHVQSASSVNIACDRSLFISAPPTAENVRFA